jgi:hypothetical protein
MNKGKRLRFCKACDRKRFCSRVPIPGFNFKITCSKGHTWIIQGITAERLQAAFEEVMLPKIKDLFNRDDIFYRSIKR